MSGELSTDPKEDAVLSAARDQVRAVFESVLPILADMSDFDREAALSLMGVDVAVLQTWGHHAEGRGVHVEGYSFTLNVELVLGVPQDFHASRWVMRAMQPRMLVANVPCPNFVVLDDVIVDGTCLKPFLKDGRMTPCDAFAFSPARADSPEDEELGAPLCDHGASMVGRYTGLVPEGYHVGSTFPLCVTLQGPAELVKEAST